MTIAASESEVVLTASHVSPDSSALAAVVSAASLVLTSWYAVTALFCAEILFFSRLRQQPRPA